MKFRQKKDNSQGIDISPLIDMVFILLIFFMVSTTFIKDMKLELDRPGAASASPASTKAVRIYIDKFGDTYMDGQPIRVWAIQGKVRELIKVSTQKNVLVVTDGDVPAQKLIEVVDQCKLAGAKEVGVATEKEAG